MSAAETPSIARDARAAQGANAAEIVLSFEERQWRARGCGIDIARTGLRDIDDAIAASFADAAAAVEVRVRFDMRSLPEWLRQYHAHYCNYSLRIAPRSAAR